MILDKQSPSVTLFIVEKDNESLIRHIVNKLIKLGYSFDIESILLTIKKKYESHIYIRCGGYSDFGFDFLSYAYQMYQNAKYINIYSIDQFNNFFLDDDINKRYIFNSDDIYDMM